MASDGRLVGDALSHSDIRAVSHLLRVAGLIDAAERFFVAPPDVVTAFCHPINLVAGMTGDASDPLAVPPHRWRYTTLTDVRRAAEESFVCLEQLASCVRILRVAEAARKRAVAGSDVLRGGGNANSFFDHQVPKPNMSAESITIAARELMEADPECNVSSSSVLGHFLNHVNGVPLTQTPVANGASAYSSSLTVTKMVLRRTSEALATDCRMMLYESHMVLVIPYPGWVADEAFAKSYRDLVGTDEQQASPTRSSPSRRRHTKPPHAMVYDLGGTHQSFVDDAVEPPPPANLPPHVQEACKLARDAFVATETAPWLRRRQNPFHAVPLFDWEPRRWLVRVIPLSHIVASRGLPRGWWSAKQRPNVTSLETAMLALAAQVPRSTPDFASASALTGFVVSRGGAGGQAFSSSPARATSTAVDTSLSFGHEAVEAQRRALAESATAMEVSVMWDHRTVTNDPQRPFGFLLKKLWGTLDATTAAAMDRDTQSYLRALRQAVLNALRGAMQRRQGAVTGFQALDGSSSSPLREHSVGGVDAMAVEALARTGSVILIDTNESPYIAPIVLDQPAFTSQHYEQQNTPGVQYQRSLRDVELYWVSDAVRHLLNFTDEHRVLSSLFSIRTLVNPDHDAPPIQRLAAGATRDHQLLESVMATTCVFHYTVEVQSIFIEPPTAEYASKNEPPQIAAQMTDAKPRYLKAFEHALLLQTANLLAVCERDLLPEHLHSDLNYRTNVLPSLRLQAGSRMCLDYSSVLSIVTSNPVVSKTGDVVVKVTMVYSGRPVVLASGAPGDFNPLDPSSTLEIHRFSIAGSRAVAEATELQNRWLRYCAAVAGCQPPDSDLRAAHGAFLASAIGQAIPLDDRKQRYQIALSVAIEWTEYHLEQSRFRKKQAAGKPGDPPRAPVPQIAIDVRPAFLSRRSLANALDAVLPHHEVSKTIFGAAVLTWQKRLTVLKTSAAPPSKELLPVVGWFRYVHALFSGTSRERMNVLLRGITHSTVPAEVGFVRKQQIATFLTGIAPDAASVAEDMWRSLPSYRQPVAPLSELEAALEQPTSPIVARLAGLHLLHKWNAPSWREALFVGNPLWRPATRVMITSSVIAAADAAARASGRRSPSPGPPVGAATTGDVSVKPEWRAAMPWLPIQQATIPQKTHIFLERKYLHQRVYSLATGAVIDEVWSAKLAAPPADMGAAVVDLCPDVCANLRDMAGVTFTDIVRSLGIATVTTSLVGGTFGGLRRLSTPYSNPSTSPLRPNSNVFVTADGEFLVQFLEPSGLHKLLTTMPKYHSHVFAQGKKTLLPRYVGLYAAYLDAVSADAPSVFDHLRGKSPTQRELVFFAVMVAPTRNLARLCAEKARFGADMITHVAGDHKVDMDTSQWRVATSTFVSPGQPVTRFDIPEDARAAALLALKKDATLLTNDCGFTGFSCAVYFFRAETFSDMPDVEFEGRVGDATQTLTNAPLLDSCVCDARVWNQAQQHHKLADRLELPSNLTASVSATASSSSSLLLTSNATPMPKRVSVVPNTSASRADEAPSYLGNLSRFEGRPVLRWSAGNVQAAHADFHESAYMVDYSGHGGEGLGSRRAANTRGATKLGGTVTVEVAPPATWTCSVCSTINMRTRNAAMIKPCHVCFGINERFGDSVIPVVTTAAEYTKLTSLARDAAAVVANATAATNESKGHNVFGMYGADPLLSPPEQRVFDRSRGVSVKKNHAALDDGSNDDDDDEDGGAGGGLFSDDVDDRYDMMVMAKPGPRKRGDNPFQRVEADMFSRLARSRNLTTSSAAVRRLSKDFLDKFEAPGTVCLPAAVQGRPDVFGFVMLFMVDTLGTVEAADAESTASTAAYLRTFQSNVMDALGDDFL